MLLRLYPRRLDDLRPLRGFAVDQGAEFFGGGGSDAGAVFGEAFGDFGGDVCIEFIWRDAHGVCVIDLRL